MLFSCFAAKKLAMLKLISWKHSFKRLSEESEMAKKKRQALDNLLSTGRISQSTYELFNEEIENAIAEVERQQKALLEKMNSNMGELEGQIKTLEILFANFEIQHVTGEVDEDVYQREINLLSAGLEVARHELEVVREALNQLSSGIQISASDVVVEQKMETQSSEKEVKVAEEKLPASSAESVEISEAGCSQASQEETQPTETATEGEEKQESQ